MLSSVPFVILLIACLSNGFELKCKFVDIEYSNWGNKYTCNAINFNIQQSNVIIVSANGRHQNGKSDIDVQQIIINNQNSAYFPHGLGNLFPRLRGINIQHSDLKNIKREDFKGLENLQALYLDHNLIEVIPENTFDDLKSLEALWMNQNNLKIIDPNIFTLLKLREADFEGNVCVNLYADSESAIEDLQNQIAEKCGRPLSLQIETIKDKVKDLEFNLSMANKHIENLSLKIFVLIENSKKIPLYCDFHLNTSEYTCIARHLYVSKKNTTIGEIRGHHHRAQSDTNVTNIYIHKQDLKYLPNGIIKKFMHLTSLIVTKSNLVFIDNDTFIGMGSLIEIVLKENSIEIVPDYVFDELHSLKTLDLSDNIIMYLPPKTFYKLTQLEVLKLNDNKIQYLPLNLFSGNLILRNLHLENNKILSIGSTILQYLTETLILADFRNNSCIDVQYPDTTMNSFLIEILKCSELNDFIKKLLPSSFSSTKYIQLEATNEINNN
ncbi:unnamed protein product [Diamesa tonsa]